MPIRKTPGARKLALGFMMSLAGPVGFADAETPPARPVGEPALLTVEEAVPAGAERAVEAQLPGTERVQERFENRTLKVERFVIEDSNGNFLNHGMFTQWDEEGRLVGKGMYLNGRRDGKWVRFYNDDETDFAFTPAIELGFEGPFVSQAEFRNGRLHGTWITVDAKKRQVSAFEFADGRRHGLSVSWYPSGKKWREVEYRDGEIDGDAAEFDVDGILVKQERFAAGFRLGVKVEYYDTGEIKSECETLFAKQVLEAEDDWWNGTCEVNIVGELGRDQRHGKFTAWNRDGQKVLEGQYIDDQPDGKFTWWHANGNKAVEGSYVDGKQHGQWTWWYSNGLKEVVGQYALGGETGQWKSWLEDGRIDERVSIFNDVGPGPAATQVTGEPTLAPKLEVVDSDTAGIEPAPLPARRASLTKVIEDVKPTTLESPLPPVPQPENGAQQTVPSQNEPATLPEPIAAPLAVPPVPSRLELSPASPAAKPAPALKPARR